MGVLKKHYALINDLDHLKTVELFDAGVTFSFTCPLANPTETSYNDELVIMIPYCEKYAFVPLCITNISEV